jgi:CheY-like chemotaxis protein
MIRTFEQSDSHAGLSLIANNHGRIPIIAVSASLIEREKDTYVSAGFDGWILKPIDFKRLETLLLGIVDYGVRCESLYVAGEWERGGWFTNRLEPEVPHRLKKKAGKAELRLEEIVQREEPPSAVG